MILEHINFMNKQTVTYSTHLAAIYKDGVHVWRELFQICVSTNHTHDKILESAAS